MTSFAALAAGAAALALLSAPAVALDLTRQSGQAETGAPRGLDAQGVLRLDAALEAWAAEGHRAGYAALIARDGEVLHAAQAGYADIESERPFTPATPVLIASMTKPVTALAIMQLVEDGAVALDQPLADFIPAYGGVQVAVSPMAGEDGAFETVPLERSITIHDLLTHTAGLGYVFDTETDLGRHNIERSLYAHPGPLSEAAADLAEVPLYMQPGTRWFYSWSNDVLGAVVEAASGQPLDVYMEAEIFEPLGMEATGFYLEADADRSQLATVYTHGEDGGLIPRIVAGEALEGPQAFQIPAGGAGLVSTAEDYMRFALMLAGGGELDGARVIEAETLAMMTSDQLAPGQHLPDNPGMGYGYGVGVALPVDNPEQSLGVPGDYFWSGYFDTIFFVSPATGLVAVMMSQEEPGPYSGENARDRFGPLAYGTLAQAE